MSTSGIVTRQAFLILWLGAGLLLGACASQPAGSGIPLAQRIENAKSRADHEWLAEYYRQQEMRSRESALLHRNMGDKYAAWGGEGRGSWGSSMALHCRNLSERFERAAEEYAAMARIQQQMAGQAPQ